MNTTLPIGIITSLETLGWRLAGIGREHRDGSLEELEQAVLEAVRTALPELLRDVVVMATSSISLSEAGVKTACPECGQRTGVQSWRSRSVLTVCGKVSFQRPWYVCPKCGCGWSPADMGLELESRSRLSAGLSDWLTRLGASSTSFEEAAVMLEELTGLEVSGETVRRRTEEQGALLEGVEQSAACQVAATREAAGQVDAAPGMMVAQTDGVMVRYLDGWHEVKLGLLGGYVDGKLVAPSYVAARQSAEEFGPRLLAEAARRGALEITGWQGPIAGKGLALLREVVVLGDGAHWIWNMADDHFGARTEIVDFYHASEHVWVAAKALYGEGTRKANSWAECQIDKLYEKGPKPLLRSLRRAKAPNDQAAEIIRRERGYFSSNASRMDYPAFLKRGLPIGSGAIESAARHLVQDRLKRPGARWSSDGAAAVLAVRCRLSSNRSLAA